MSKRIAYVHDLHLESPGGEPYYRTGSDGGISTIPNETPWMARQLVFLLERIVDAKFVEGKEPIDGEILRDDVRGAIKRQAKEAAVRGYWELDDASAQRLMNATMTPATPPNPGVAFNYVPFIRAVRDMTTPPEVIELPPVSNGAAVASA